MQWLKEILLILVKKLKSWEAFALCLIGILGYIGLEFYKAQTERMIATSMKPKAETTEILVQNKPTQAGVGIIKEEKSQIKGAK